jgi:hypothetical protein
MGRVYIQTDVNGTYSSFLTKYLKYFLNIFPLKNSQKIKASIRMVNKRDKSIGTEAAIVMFVKENDVLVQ